MIFVLAKCLQSLEMCHLENNSLGDFFIILKILVLAGLKTSIQH